MCVFVCGLAQDEVNSIRRRAYCRNCWGLFRTPEWHTSGSWSRMWTLLRLFDRTASQYTRLKYRTFKFFLSYWELYGVFCWTYDHFHERFGNFLQMLVWHVHESWARKIGSLRSRLALCCATRPNRSCLCASTFRLSSRDPLITVLSMF